MTILRPLILIIAAVLSAASARSDANTAKIPQQQQQGAPQYCSHASSGDDVCAPTYYECVSKKEREQKMGRSMAECLQQ